MGFSTANNFKILVADHSPLHGYIKQLLCDYSAEFSILSAGTDDEFKQSFNSHSVHVLILNPGLPGLGQEGLDQFFEQKGTDLPVILLNEPVGQSIERISLNNCHVLCMEEEYVKGLPLLVDALLRHEKEKKAQREIAKELLESRERYLDIFDNTSDLIQCVAPDGSFIYTNKAWRETLGYSESEVNSLRLTDVLHAESQLCCTDRFKRLLDGERLSCIEFKFISKSGEIIHLTGDCGSIVKEGRTVSTRGIFKNMTETVKAEQALQISEKRYQALYDNAPDIYITLNIHGEILSINRIGAAQLGYDVNELIGESAAYIIHPEDQEKVFIYVAETFSRKMEEEGIEYRLVKKSGAVLWVHQKVNVESNESEPRLLVICRDITEKRELEAKLAYQATHDPLTNLINRRELESRLQRLIMNKASARENHVLCYMDLDKFKIINDTCGHMAGDKLLCQISTLLQGQIRSRDTLARLGGDEFAVLMEYCTIKQAQGVAEKVRKKIDNFKFYWRSHKFSIGISIGMVEIRNSTSMEEIINSADAACYQAKNNGRNCVSVYQNELTHH